MTVSNEKVVEGSAETIVNTCHSCGKTSRFSMLGAFHFCSNRCVRIYARRFPGLFAKRPKNADLKLIAHAQGDNTSAGRYAENRMKFDRHEKYIPFVHRDASGKVISFNVME